MAAAALSHASVDDLRSLSRQPHSDPDIQATLSDFLTYTEHFPSHLVRALTLIQEQRTKAENAIRSVHNDTTAYSTLPTIKHDRPDPVQLRKAISLALEEAEAACRMSMEEAVRLDDECQREAKRLDIVADKLSSQPKPPSRDPTPEQQALTWPNLKRERRLSTRADDAKLEKQSRRAQDKAASKLRGRKIMVPGEVLPPPDPNAPLDNMSDWTSPRPSPPLLDDTVVEQDKKKLATPRPRSRTPKPPKTDKERREKQERDRKAESLKPRGPRAPGQPGTNAHSAVAGISTSNALLALTEPPADAAKGSKWLPWVKLTEWEMAKLRKRMKKNAIWVPSQTMVRRELKNLGRGLAGKEAARQDAEANGTTFVDEGNELDPTKVMISGEETDQINAMLGPQVYADDDDADAELINRGMRLNEAKKLKRQRLLEEQALQAQLAREQGVDTPVEGTKPTSPEAQKKRKREATPAAGSSKAANVKSPEARANPPKRLKLTGPSNNSQTTSRVPLAPAGASSSPKAMTSSRSRKAATPPASRRPTITIKVGKAVSEEPPNRRQSLRRGSNASLPSNSVPSVSTPTSPKSTGTSKDAVTKSGRRSRRPPPGVITNNDDDSAKATISQRKAAPNRRRGQAIKKDSATPADQPGLSAIETPEEYIDPDEPRYCICGDVSWGTMIACDNETDCEKEWFHLDCVQLKDLPPRRTKWYCPDCRKKLKLGQNTNGLVGRNIGVGGR
ncbi:Putative inhibitor of growth histone-binding protein [Septoria linicola]|uniref:Inhibitor of growth histone-binding protein n=1 Tax=Septoria linicola TaxID=215465 RepID=A0A9Q9ALT2_9PEZI|nr:putative inhibitor of growth histone-binding protein [Septoria linicola]USW48276.1 Putative inhibitor of growth histone-binding protein [Septoria linicola]